jgi:hypothetical protein
MTTTVQLDTAISRVRSANPAMRPTLMHSVLTMGTDLADERDRLTVKLEKQWTWLQLICPNHERCTEDHDAVFHERETLFLAALEKYESIETSLAGALHLLESESCR